MNLSEQGTSSGPQVTIGNTHTCRFFTTVYISLIPVFRYPWSQVTKKTLTNPIYHPLVFILLPLETIAGIPTSLVTAHRNKTAPIPARNIEEYLCRVLSPLLTQNTLIRSAGQCSAHYESAIPFSYQPSDRRSHSNPMCYYNYPRHC